MRIKNKFSILFSIGIVISSFSQNWNSGRDLSIKTSLSILPEKKLDFVDSRIYLHSSNNHRGSGIFSLGETNYWFFGNPYTDHANSFMIGIKPKDEKINNTAQLKFAKFYLNKEGLIGLGTTSPKAKLHVKDNHTSELIIEGDGLDAINAGIVLKANNGNNERGLGMFMFDKGNNNEWFIGRPYADSDKFVINKRNNISEHSTFTSSIHHNKDNSKTKSLFVLDDSGNAALQGKFESTEIKVTKTPTADFVFESNYELPSLKFVENYIKKEKHLPEISSAKEMVKNGVNIGEFQIKLLQKIEELTLYIIKQDHKIKNQNKALEILNSKFLELQKNKE